MLDVILVLIIVSYPNNKTCNLKPNKDTGW